LAVVFGLTLAALAVARTVARGRRRRLFGSDRAHPGRRLTSDTGLMLAWFAIAVALAAPRIGERTLRIPARGVDVVFLLDVSRSMAARDVAPSRLDRAQRAVEEIIGRLAPGDRVALAVFASRGLLLAPLTPDHAAVVELAGATDVALMQPAGSKLGAGVATAVTAFESGSERPRVLVVLSDGEDPRRREAVGIATATSAAARAVTIALGTETGSFVPDGPRPLVDEVGETVRSHRDRDRLARLAEETGGRAFDGDAFGRIDFAAAAAEVRRDLGVEDGFVEYEVAAVRTAPFAALAFSLLLLEGLARPRRTARVRRDRPRRVLRIAGGVALAVVLASGADSSDPASDEASERLRANPRDARAQVELGLAHLAANRVDAAVRAFEAATVYSGESPLGAVAWFDLGVARLARDDVEAARAAFLRALEIDPDDDQARFNLEWSSTPRRSPAAPRAANAAPAEREAGDPAATEKAPSDREAVGAADVPELDSDRRRRLLDRVEDAVGRSLASEDLRGAASDARTGRVEW
jgi:Ca-activated chloride channel family protein